MDESVFVSPEWLADRLDDPDVRIVDVREPWEYESIGHIPGAVNIPFDEIRDPGGEAAGMLPGKRAFESVLGQAGVAPDDTLVAYDDTHGVFAARFIVTAYVYGHRDARVLDGDFSRWNRIYETSTDAPAVDLVDYHATPLPADVSPLIDRGAVEAAIGTDVILVDTREAWEYDEGHLPGAVRFDWRSAVDPETRGLRPREEVRDLLESAGITPDRRIVLYCNTARRISHTYLVLRWLGYPEVDFYEGSLTEWLSAGKEVETGPSEE